MVLIFNLLNYVCTITLLADEDPFNADSQELPPSVSPELVCNFFQSVAFGAVAPSIVTFEFLWSPHMCVLAAEGVGHCQVWKESQSFGFMVCVTPLDTNMHTYLHIRTVAHVHLVSVGLTQAHSNYIQT